MKTITEAAQEALLKVSEDTRDTALQPGKRTPTVSDGSGTKDLTAPGTFQRPGPDEARDILWKLSTIKLWQIRPEDQKDVKNALSVLAWATIPATIDEAVYWLTRLIAHFPRRDATKDAVVIADLAADLFDAEVSLIALVATCDALRKAATKKDPWFPPSGEILSQAKETTKMYKAAQERLKAPVLPALAAPAPRKADPLPWDDMALDDMPDEVRVGLYEFLAGFGSLGVKSTYCRCLGFEYDQLEQWINDRKVDQNVKEPEEAHDQGDHGREDRDHA